MPISLASYRRVSHVGADCGTLYILGWGVGVAQARDSRVLLVYVYTD